MQALLTGRKERFARKRMNKRQLKKKQKKHEMFSVTFVASYRELKQIDRDYHEYVVNVKRRKITDDISEF